jgi:hypothetical protein
MDIPLRSSSSREHGQIDQLTNQLRRMHFNHRACIYFVTYVTEQEHDCRITFFVILMAEKIPCAQEGAARGLANATAPVSRKIQGRKVASAMPRRAWMPGSPQVGSAIARRAIDRY